MDPSTNTTSGNRTHLTAIVIATLVGALLRLFRLEQQSLWIDEIFTVAAASGSWAEVIFAPRAATNIPPLYYALLHVLGLENGGELALRLPSALAGVATLPLLARVAWRWYGGRVAAATCWILAISPFHLWYSQEARPYALLILLAVSAVAVRQQVDRCDGQRSGTCWRVLFAVMLAAVVYCHTVGIALVGALGVAALWGATKEQRLREWLTFGFAGVLMIPAAALILSYPVAPVPAKSIAYLPLVLPPFTLWTFGVGHSVGPSVDALHRSGRLQAVLQQAWVVAPAFLLLVVVSAKGWLEVWRASRARVELLTWLLVPVALGVLGSAVTVQSFNVRHASTAFPAFALLLAAGLCGLRNARVRSVAWLLIVLLSVVGVYNHFFDARYHKSDARAVAKLLNEQGSADDYVIASASYMRDVVRHYTSLRARFPQHPPLAPLESTAEGERVVRAWMTGIGIGEVELSAEEPLPETVWVYYTRTYHGDRSGLIAAYLRQSYAEEVVLEGSDERLLRFQRRP